MADQPTTKYEIPEWPISRPRYFDNLFLQSQDFVDEQAFHIASRRRSERLLRLTGVAEGLAVKAVPDQPQLRVDPGTAFDSQGRMILLSEGQNLSLNGTTGERYLFIEFKEDPTGLSPLTAQGTGLADNNRFLQKPSLVLRQDASGSDGVLLARVKLTPAGVASSEDLRQGSGLQLPTLGAGSPRASLLADKEGNLLAAGPTSVQLAVLGPGNPASINRVLTVTAAGMQLSGSLEIKNGGALSVTGLLTAGPIIASGLLRANDGVAATKVVSGEISAPNGPLCISGTSSKPNKNSGAILRLKKTQVNSEYFGFMPSIEFVTDIIDTQPYLRGSRIEARNYAPQDGLSDAGLHFLSIENNNYVSIAARNAILKGDVIIDGSLKFARDRKPYSLMQIGTVVIPEVTLSGTGNLPNAEISNGDPQWRMVWTEPMKGYAEYSSPYIVIPDFNASPRIFLTVLDAVPDVHMSPTIIEQTNDGSQFRVTCQVSANSITSKGSTLTQQRVRIQWVAVE